MNGFPYGMMLLNWRKKVKIPQDLAISEHYVRRKNKEDELRNDYQFS